MSDLPLVRSLASARHVEAIPLPSSVTNGPVEDVRVGADDLGLRAILSLEVLLQADLDRADLTLDALDESLHGSIGLMRALRRASENGLRLPDPRGVVSSEVADGRLLVGLEDRISHHAGLLEELRETLHRGRAHRSLRVHDARESVSRRWNDCCQTCRERLVLLRLEEEVVQADQWKSVFVNVMDLLVRTVLSLGLDTDLTPRLIRQVSCLMCLTLLLGRLLRRGHERRDVRSHHLGVVLHEGVALDHFGCPLHVRTTVVLILVLVNVHDGGDHLLNVAIRLRALGCALEEVHVPKSSEGNARHPDLDARIVVEGHLIALCTHLRD